MFKTLDQQKPDEVSPTEAQRQAEFESIFGPPPAVEDFPEAVNPSWAARVARVKYEQDLRLFEGLVGRHPGYTDILMGFYLNLGFGQPVFYSLSNVDRVAWPECLFGIQSAPLNNAVKAPGPLAARLQAQAVLKGHFVPRLHSFVPGYIAEINEALRPDEVEEDF